MDELPKEKIDVRFIPLEPIPAHRRKEFDKYFSDDYFYNFTDPELLICPSVTDNINSPVFRLNYNSRRTLFTMWEATNVSFNFVEEMNKMKMVLVPNNYNKYHFERQGVRVPIEVVPLYVNANKFSDRFEKQNDVFVFGTGNRDPRKRLDRTISNFKRAFPKEKDVALMIKLSPHEESLHISDNRILVHHGFLSDNQLSAWYQSLNVFLSSVSAEGWGMMQAEAMACGIPVIATKYAGLAEFLNEENGFVVPHREVPADSYWNIPGARWSDFKDSDFIDQMRFAYNNRSEVLKKGILSKETMKQFTLQRFLKELTTKCFEE